MFTLCWKIFVCEAEVSACLAVSREHLERPVGPGRRVWRTGFRVLIRLRPRPGPNPSLQNLHLKTLTIMIGLPKHPWYRCA